MLASPASSDVAANSGAVPETVLMIRLHLPLVKALLLQGVRVTSVGVPPRAGLANREDEVHSLEGLHHVPWTWHGRPLVDGFRVIPTIIRLIRETKPKVIHANAFSDLLFIAIAIRIACQPERRPIVVGMARNPTSWASHRQAWLRVKLVKHLADGVVALADSHKRQMVTLGLSEEKAATIPNPYDEALLDFTVRDQRQPRPLSVSSPRITYVAALRERKAHDVLIKAVAEVLHAHPNVSVDLIGSEWPGEESYAQHLRQLVERLDLIGHVHFRGELPHAKVMSCLAATDIVAFPTYAEMMPRAVIEAMMLGRPVIASGVDGILDLIKDRQTGLLVRPGDVGGLAQAICELTTNPIWAAELASEGENYVRVFCSPERIGRLFCEFYTELLRSSPCRWA